MPRIRTIKPEFFTSPDVGRLSLSARLTFIGLWVFVDDEGRGMDVTRVIKAVIWPLDDCMSLDAVENDLRALAKAGLILRYRSRDGQELLAVTKWHKHQRVSHPTPSKYPAPPSSRKFREPSRSTPDPLGSPPDPLRGERKGKEGNGKERKGTAATAADDSPGFSDAWAAYPKRPNNSRAKARRAWEARIAEGTEPQVILAGVQAYAAYVARTDTPERFVKLASTFFGPDKHWETDYGNGTADEIQVYDPKTGEVTHEFAKEMGLLR